MNETMEALHNCAVEPYFHWNQLVIAGTTADRAFNHHMYGYPWTLLQSLETDVQVRVLMENDPVEAEKIDDQYAMEECEAIDRQLLQYAT